MGRTDILTNLSLRVALLSLECYVVVRAEGEVATFAPERRRVSAVFTFGATGPFQVEPDSESNARTELGTYLTEFADVFRTVVPSSGLTLWWNWRERGIDISVGSLEAG